MLRTGAAACCNTLEVSGLGDVIGGHETNHLESGRNWVKLFSFPKLLMTNMLERSSSLHRGTERLRVTLTPHPSPARADATAKPGSNAAPFLARSDMGLGTVSQQGSKVAAFSNHVPVTILASLPKKPCFWWQECGRTMCVGWWPSLWDAGAFGRCGCSRRSRGQRGAEAENFQPGQKLLDKK